MRKRTALVAVVAMIATTLLAGLPAGATVSSGDRVGTSVAGYTPASLDEHIQVFIQLDEPSVAEFAHSTNANGAAQRAQGSRIQAQQDQVAAAIADFIIEERSRLVVGANGIRAIVRAGDVFALRAVAGVKSVERVAVFYPDNETSVPFINATAADTGGLTGEGTTIAVIDTGIDYLHEQFGGDGDPDDYADNDKGLIEAGTFPTDKVVGGFDFAGPIYDASSDDPLLNTPRPDSDPLDGHGHGTHVSGSAAGIETDELGAGVAPEASLLALKVFGDIDGSTDVVSDAIEMALDPNNDLSMEDAVDVINMSLGSDFGSPDDPTAISSQNAAENGVVVVTSAGNAGPVPYVVGSPAVADDVIAVAATTDDGVTASAITVNDPAGIAGEYEAQIGDFGSLDDAVTGDLAFASPLDACTPIADNVDGQIAFLQRGGCDFTVKIQNAQDAGAIAAVVFNNADGAPIVMGQNANPVQPDIPAVMISLADGETIADALDGDDVNVTLDDETVIPKPELAGVMADFTSRGPGFGNVFKPDISAPGFMIESAGVGTGTEGALSSGTSMASPHIAGVAAQLREKYPDLPVDAIKSLMMNSASPAVPDGEVPLATQGTGIVDAGKAATDLGGYTTPAGLSFGFINPSTAYSDSERVTITRLANNATYSATIVPNQTVPGVTWGLSKTSVSTSGRTGSINVNISVNPNAMEADDSFVSQRESDGWLVLTNNADSDDQMVVGLMAVVDPAAGLTAEGGVAEVSVANGGAAEGFADGFTVAAGHDAVVGDLASAGYRTYDSGDGYDVIEFGVALSAPWASPSAYEIDLLIDTDEDGQDDYAVVAADLGYLQGAPDPAGQIVTALFDLVNGGGTLLYFAGADNNDHVMIMPADLTGDFGFMDAGDTTMDVTAVVFAGDGAVGISDTVSIDLEDEIMSDEGLSFLVAPGDEVEADVVGDGDLLWLFPGNPVPGQAVVTTVDKPDPNNPFVDVPSDHLFATEIAWLAEKGITKGCNPPTNDRFCPDDPVSRGQMAAFLNRALDLPMTPDDFFVDDADSVFEKDINELAASGITRGCNPPTNDMFCPDRELTRAEMATFMVRGFGFTDRGEIDRFVDDDNSEHEMAIDILATAGVTKGCNPPVNDQFCPERLITRGEMAAFIYRAYQAAGLED